MAIEKESNPAQLRGDIAKGRAGGKRPGIDPSAAPLETDSEAGGEPMGEDQVRTARATQSKDNTDEAVSYGTAMRNPDGVETRPKGSRFMLYAFALIMLLVILSVAIGVLV